MQPINRYTYVKNILYRLIGGCLVCVFNCLLHTLPKADIALLYV